jgi:hypothetical protein
MLFSGRYNRRVSRRTDVSRSTRLVAVALLIAGAHALPAGEDHAAQAALVPWRVAEPGAVIDSPLVLYWIPTSPDDLRHSPLLVSEDLALFSDRCVAMRVVRPNDTNRLVQLAEEGTPLPLAVLATGDGQVLGRITGDSITAVEDLVREELDHRTALADTLLDQARAKAEAHDTAAATLLYEAVWEARCLCPRHAKDARKALKKLAAGR